MNKRPSYWKNIPTNQEEREEFHVALMEAEQDHKRILALQKHYRVTSDKRLPLEYGHVLILKETLKQRFLTSGEKGLLLCLLERLSVDYTFTCYKKSSERRKKNTLRAEQIDMFPELHVFSWSEVPVAALGELILRSQRPRLLGYDRHLF